MIIIYNTCNSTWPEVMISEMFGETTFTVLEDVCVPCIDQEIKAIVIEDFVDLRTTPLDKALVFHDFIIANKSKVIVNGVSDIFKSTIHLSDIVRFCREKINERK